jgi:hypothetical protein
MKKGITILGILVSIVLLTILPIACGGGGGGSDDGGGGKSGSTQKLDEKNVSATLNTLDTAIPFCALNATAPNTGTALRSVLNLSHAVMNQVEGVHGDYATLATLVDQSPAPIPGTCTTNPGHLDITFGIDEDRGLFQGSIDFEMYCAAIDTDNVSIDGSGDYDGTLVLDDAEDLQSATLNFSTDSGGIDIATAEGTANLDIDGFQFSLNTNTDGSGSVTMSLTRLTVVAAGSEGTDTFTLTDFSLSVGFSDTGAVIRSQGTINQTGEGTVNFAINNLTADANGNVSGGNIVVNGADDTSITITPTSGNDFTIEADTDGDGVNDYNPGTMSCDENLMSGISLF